jgi:hypothetical protein
VVLLDTAEARVLVAGDLSMGFWDLWCYIVVEAASGFHRMAMGDIGGVGLAYVAEVVAVGGGYFGGAAARAKTLASVPVDKISRWCIEAPRVLIFLC